MQKLKDATFSGAAFSTKFTKNRGFCPSPELAPSMKLVSTSEGKQEWYPVVTSEEEKRQLAFEMHQAGKSYRDIEKHLGIGKSTVSRWMQNT